MTQTPNQQPSLQQLKTVIDNSNVSNAFFNLYERWLDECKYEDINDYGRFLVATISQNFPSADIKYISSTKRPFGVKALFNSKPVHFSIHRKGDYASLRAQLY